MPDLTVCVVGYCLDGEQKAERNAECNAKQDRNFLSKLTFFFNIKNGQFRSVLFGLLHALL
jgi:hypothetical protein